MNDPELDGADPQTTKEFVREAVTMALYLSLSLIAVLLAIPAPSPEEGDPIKVMFLTASGLLIAHLLAGSIASRLVSRGLIDPEGRAVAIAQIVGGLGVIALVIAPLLVLNPPWSLRMAVWLLLAFVCWVGYVAARQASVSRIRALAYVAVILLVVVAVLFIKSFVGH